MTRNCNRCDTKNSILTNGYNYAFECDYCGERQWIDELGKEDCMILLDICEEEANQLMIDGRIEFNHSSIGLLTH